MAQNNLMENPHEAITIKEYLEKMLREENISLKILEKSNQGNKKTSKIFEKMNRKLALIKKAPLIRLFLDAEHVLQQSHLAFVLDVFYHVIWNTTHLK